MKKLLIAAAFVSSFASANNTNEIWFELNNNASGKIILSMEKCPRDNKGKLALTTSDQYPTIFGCWYYAADMVHVFWDNNKTWSYPASEFKMKPDQK